MYAHGRLTWVSILALVGLGACERAPRPDGTVTIVAAHGRFSSVEEAARAESRVDWFDGDSLDDDACTESFAATELKRFLPACLGVEPSRVRFADALPGQGDAIVLGNRRSQSSVASLADGAAPPPQGYRLGLERRDGRRVIRIEGGDRAGTLYGTYALLERLGARFHGLGDTGTVLPRSASPWPRSLSAREAPAFDVRGFWAWEPRGNREFFEWMGRNRMNLWTSADTAYVPLMKKLGIRLSGGGHTIQADFLDPKRHFTAHPDWYGLHDGKRSPNIREESGDNFCTGNPDARRHLARELAASLSTGSLRHADVLEVWMLDGGRWCECSRCEAQGSPSDRVLAVAKDVAAAADSARRSGRLARPVEVRTLAYLETSRPPRPGPPDGVTVTFYPYYRCYAHAFADTSCTEMNAGRAADFRGWRAARPSGSWAVCEYYNVGSFHSLPLVFSRSMARDVRWYRGSGATDLTYMHAPTRRWGSWTLHQSLLASLLWNPDTDPDSFLTRFCGVLYPGAATHAARFYRELEIASANIMALQGSAGVYGSAFAGGRLGHSATPVFPLLHLRDSTFHPPSNDGPDLDEIAAAMEKARGHLNQALASARGPLARARLEDVEQRFAFGEAMFQLYSALLRTALAHRARDGDRARREFGRARSAAATLREVRDLLQVAASHANARDGFEASRMRPTYEYFERLYGP